MDWIFGGIFVNLLSEFVVVVAGVLFAQFIRSRLDKHRFGGWHVIIRRNGEAIDTRPVSPGKIKQIHEIPEELSVFLKGVASGYDWINCDLVTEGRDLGMLVEDAIQRTYVIDLDLNPVQGRMPASGPQPGKPPTIDRPALPTETQ